MMPLRPSRLSGRFSLRRWLGACLVFALLASPVTPAFAQEVDDATRSAARQLAVEGSEFYEHENFEQAYDRFSRAYVLVRAPTVGLWAARSLQKLGRWVEASERFLEVQRQPLAEGAPPEHQQAQAEASVERQALLPRIPSLRVLVEGAEPSDVFITLNGELLPAALIGVGRPVDPGKVDVKGTRGSDVVAASVQVAEGESRDLKLSFRPVAPLPVAAGSEAVLVEPEPARERADPGQSQRTLGWVTLGVGGASLVLGSVFGLLGLSQKSDLEAACPERSCPPAQYDELDTYETRRTIASIGLIAGGVLAASGVTLVLTAPSPRPPASHAVTPRLGFRIGFERALLFGELP
jgi:hypothetical protein